MTEKAKRILARLGKSALLIILLNMIFAAIRRFGHEVLEVGIYYQGNFLVQYEFGEECVLDAIAFLTALVPPLLYLLVQEKRAQHTIHEAWRRKLSLPLRTPWLTGDSGRNRVPALQAIVKAASEKPVFVSPYR